MGTTEVSILVFFAVVIVALIVISVLFSVEGESELAFHPMDQFMIKPLFGEYGDPVYWYTVTNLTFWMALAVLCVVLMFVLGTRGRAIVPGRSQSVAELTYGFVFKMVEDVTGKEAVKFFPYIFTLFLFILFANFVALIPTSASPTSQIAVTAFLALAVFLTVTVVGFVKNGMKFLGLFWVSSAPLALRPILAGHAVIKVFAGFAAITAIAPVSVLAITAIYGLEVLVAFIQAYVFTILTCVYLKDALHPSH
jgi:F-type H+-transporting ATPase subunit a